MSKGISPLIASVLLIVFTVAVAGFLSVWLIGFTRTSSEVVEEESLRELVCRYGGISISNLKFYTSNDWLTGDVENTRTITLGNITIQVIYNNGTSQKNDLSIELTPREIYSFNISVSSNYDRIRALTNCSSVYDEASASDVTIF